MKDLHILPKLRDSLSYLYFEHAILQRFRNAVEAVSKEGRVSLPVASLSVLFLGPGTSITHEAIKVLAENGCSIIWVGEDVTRFYAQGTGETRKAQRLLKQAQLVSDLDQRQAVARRMYTYRFDEELDPDLNLEQIRGREGVRVRNTYKMMSHQYGVKWKGRRYDRNEWEASDPINRALSLANALLNGICHAAIVSGGYSTALGFIHTGKQLAFVYDVADLYKTELTIPTAFEVVAMGVSHMEATVRRQCRERFKQAKLLQRILPDIDKLLNMVEIPEPDYDEDMALPGPLLPDIDFEAWISGEEQW